VPDKIRYDPATTSGGAWSVVNFLIPLYGLQIGLDATRIGTMMGCFPSWCGWAAISIPANCAALQAPRSDLEKHRLCLRMMD